MRTWPQIITVFAFFIDKVNLQRRDPFEEVPRCFTTADEELNYKRYKLCEEHILREYRIFNGDFNAEDEQLASEYPRMIANLLGVDLDRIEWLKSDIEEKRKMAEAQDEELDKLSKEKDDILKANKDIDAKILEIEKSIETDTTKTREDLEDVNKAIEKLPALKKELDEHIAKLEVEIKAQPCTVEELENLKKEIDVLNNKIDIKAAKVKHAREIKEEYDLKLDEERITNRDMVIKWNMSLMKVIIKMPNLNQLLLPENGFHSKSYFEQLEEMLQMKDTVERQLIADISATKAQLQENIDMKRELKTSIAGKQAEIQKMRQEIETVTKEVEHYELEIDTIKNKQSKMEDELQQKLWELSNSSKLKELKATCDALTEKRNMLEIKRKKTGEKILATFIEVYDIMRKKIEMMVKVGNELEDSVHAATAAVVQKQEKKLQVCRALKEIQVRLTQLQKDDKDSKT
ncbi:unnamed protein product [Acanthoscelides obtectus]|nr:unnamed protein product [Acanthoscelides obtectus]CAK1626899.1 hypothetical protein AOBTE_LOCUS4141 [Acanthoscelides obtectus]